MGYHGFSRWVLFLSYSCFVAMTTPHQPHLSPDPPCWPRIQILHAKQHLSSPAQRPPYDDKHSSNWAIALAPHVPMHDQSAPTDPGVCPGDSQDGPAYVLDFRCYMMFFWLRNLNKTKGLEGSYLISISKIPHVRIRGRQLFVCLFGL